MKCKTLMESYLFCSRLESSSPEHSLQLLHYHFADFRVRALAVAKLDKIGDDDLVSFLLQLVQVRLTLKSCPLTLAYMCRCCGLSCSTTRRCPAFCSSEGSRTAAWRLRSSGTCTWRWTRPPSACVLLFSLRRYASASV